ncbi:hypothetical protein FOZ60_014336 [Perkinsus olseni]|uniref:Uncharacterized protein n=1 Tax=Perkinsus olseni TaxID=32597 RepID=A0A7J6P9I5_PEROL|nr:hypothetical protein FOZ60_014336 [Perkinsus olseni]
MALSSSLLNNTFWCIGLVSCLLVYLTKAQEFRQQELLYGQLRDGEVEYIVLPRPRTPINSPKTSNEAGISTTFQLFPHKVSSRTGTPGTTHLETCDYVTHNALFDDNTPVKMPRILRVEGGITVEYLASVAGDGNCFDRIWKWKSSEDGGEYVDASGQIDNELAELCHTGFVALEPSPDVSTLDGIYTGDGPGKGLYFDFNNGTLKDAYLSVRRDQRENTDGYVLSCM